MKKKCNYAESERFGTWAVVELFGHTVLAGYVSDCQIGDATFIRVDVPDIPNSDGFTKLFSAGAIYAMTPCTEEKARMTIVQRKPRPFDTWE